MTADRFQNSANLIKYFLILKPQHPDIQAV
jgi:hypothetical protein